MRCDVRDPVCMLLCFLQNLPNDWGDIELTALFAQYGTVLECRMLHNGDMTRGAGALVRMSTIQQASVTIEALNNVGNGLGLPLLVRCEQITMQANTLPVADLRSLTMSLCSCCCKQRHAAAVNLLWLTPW